MEEPKRKSFLDVVKHNLSLADRSEPVTRFVYVGSYSGCRDDLQRWMKNNVKELNEEYKKIVFTGLLLVYPESVVHLIEASEEAIYKHLQFVQKDKSSMLKNVILLPARYFLYMKYFSEWHMAYVTNPPMLFDQIDSQELEEVGKQIRNCLFKIYSLCEYLSNHKKMIDHLKDLSELQHLLPEVTVVEYILSLTVPEVQNLKMYLKEFNQVPLIHLYNGKYHRLFLISLG
ncbi:testis-expressed protein 47-like [Copidosoma floridanum]|uniref:testis-expressed protein 47-like n=1 Tax=Copidosoma floridanum TaxID=29053 RepID=UPI0006C9E059|nr:testis-expressed protein 47-like [Copidosoma floridanum]